MCAITAYYSGQGWKIRPSSWYSLAVKPFCNVPRPTKRRTVLTGILGGLLIAFWAIFIVEVITIEIIESSRTNTWCVAGPRDYATGLVQYPKLFLEFLSVTVYAIGPQDHLTLGRVRHATLSLILLLSWICFGMYEPKGQWYFFHSKSMRDTKVGAAASLGTCKAEFDTGKGVMCAST